MLAALVASIHEAGPPGDQVLDVSSRLLPTPATGTNRSSLKIKSGSSQVNSSQVKLFSTLIVAASLLPF